MLFLFKFFWICLQSIRNLLHWITMKFFNSHRCSTWISASFRCSSSWHKRRRQPQLRRQQFLEISRDPTASVLWFPPSVRINFLARTEFKLIALVSLQVYLLLPALEQTTWGGCAFWGWVLWRGGVWTIPGPPSRTPRAGSKFNSIDPCNFSMSFFSLCHFQHQMQDLELITCVETTQPRSCQFPCSCPVLGLSQQWNLLFSWLYCFLPSECAVSGFTSAMMMIAFHLT